MDKNIEFLILIGASILYVGAMIINLVLSCKNFHEMQSIKNPTKRDKKIPSMKSLCGRIPKGWFVYEMGQSPVHMLWFCVMIQFESMLSGNNTGIKRVFVEECQSIEMALIESIGKINNNEFETIENKE
jgi:hypothetical protein